MSVAGTKDRVECLLDQLDRFKELSGSTLKRAQKEHPFSPSQAERIVLFAARQFGKDGAIGAVDILKECFVKDTWYGWNVIYPHTQVSLLDSLVKLEKIDSKTALYVLKKLEFYHRGNSCPRKAQEEIIDPSGSSSFRSTSYGKEMCLAPIEIFGNQYGLNAAMEVLEEARHHYYMSDGCGEDFRTSVRDYFNKLEGADIEKVNGKFNRSFWAHFKDCMAGDDD